jgi:hypothetical protein
MVDLGAQSGIRIELMPVKGLPTFCSSIAGKRVHQAGPEKF